MPGSFRIFRIAGIDINIHISWLIILVFLTFSLATGWFPITYPGSSTATYYLLGFIASILLFVSVLLHELAHSFVARSRGLQVKSIVLFIFGGVSNIEQEPQTPGIEFSMAFVGPLVSLLIGVVCYGLWLLVRGTHSLIVPILSYLALMNIILGIFNLIPGFPLDGGRVLRSIIWKATGNFQTATNITTFVGQAFAYLIILWGILLFFAGNGASEVIDYTREHFEEKVKDVDVVLDTVGGETQERSWGVLRRGGILISIVSPVADEKAASLGVRHAR